MNEERRKWFVEQAQKKWGTADGSCHVNSDAPVSEPVETVGPGDAAGSYVQAWVFVYEDKTTPLPE